MARFGEISSEGHPTYFIELMRAIILRGASLGEFWMHLVILSGMGFGLFALCALRFRQKII